MLLSQKSSNSKFSPKTIVKKLRTTAESASTLTDEKKQQKGESKN